ncbi:MAG TPA: FprA family A-type flavoprotein [Proteobacteria bacterium]|nr:FprA family A-type flavoprotein [Pseudomonadota bacterium]
MATAESNSDKAVKIIDGVWWVGVNDHFNPLFEGLWALPHGISYNAYLVQGKNKTALIELSRNGFAETFIKKIEQIMPLTEIDYIVHNHLEPDHSGIIPIIYKACPQAEIIASGKGKVFLEQFYGEGKRVRAVGDGDSLDLGGRTLRFLGYPWLHWPDTMFSYLVEDKVLFPCDAFGGFGALDRGLFDDEIDLASYWPEAKRYLGTIVASYLGHVIKAIDKWVKGGMGINILCPSHGPVYRSNPMSIISRYQEWARNDKQDKVVMVVGSMWGNTHQMGAIVKHRLEHNGFTVKYFDAALAEPGQVLGEMLNAGGIVFGGPTYDTNIYPRLEYYLMLFRGKKKNGYPVATFTQNSWKVDITPKINRYLEDLKAQVVSPQVVAQGPPDNIIKKKLELLADNLAAKIKDSCFIPEG